MNILIIGFGSVGSHYFKILKNDKKIKNIYLLDNEKKIYHKKIKQIDQKDFLKNKYKINYAIICTPSSSHYYHAMLCLKKKINVLIEKPFVLKLKEAKKLISLAKKTKVKCWTALQNRYNLAVDKMLETTKSRKIGKIVTVESNLFWHRSKKYYSNNWRGKYATDGGVLVNQGIHLLDMLIYIFGEIKNFNVFSSFNKKKLEAEDLISINFLHKSGVVSSYKATTRADRDYEASIDVVAEKKRFKIRGISLNSFHYWKKNKFLKSNKSSEFFKNMNDPKSGMGNGHKKILKEFLNKKINISSKSIEIKNNLYVLKVIHSIYNCLLRKNKNLNTVRNKQSKLGIK